MLKIIGESHDEAKRLLTEHRQQLDALVEALLSRETLNEQEILEVWGSRPRRPWTPGCCPLLVGGARRGMGHDQHRSCGHALLGITTPCCSTSTACLTRTASVHAAAWKRLFDEFLEQRAADTGEAFVPFDIDADYRRYVDGKPRYDGVAAFLVARD